MLPAFLAVDGFPTCLASALLDLEQSQADSDDERSSPMGDFLGRLCCQVLRWNAHMNALKPITDTATRWSTLDRCSDEDATAARLLYFLSLAYVELEEYHPTCVNIMMSNVRTQLVQGRRSECETAFPFNLLIFSV